MQKVSCTQGAKVSEKSFAPPETAFAPVPNGVAPVQEALCSLGPKDLLHPPLSTFGNFPFSVKFPGPQLPNTVLTTPSLGFAHQTRVDWHSGFQSAGCLTDSLVLSLVPPSAARVAGNNETPERVGLKLVFRFGIPVPLRDPPRNPGKFLKNYNLAHPGPVLKIAEILGFFFVFFAVFRSFSGPNCNF